MFISLLLLWFWLCRWVDSIQSPSNFHNDHQNFHSLLKYYTTSNGFMLGRPVTLVRITFSNLRFENRAKQVYVQIIKDAVKTFLLLTLKFLSVEIPQQVAFILQKKPCFIPRKGVAVYSFLLHPDITCV